MRNFIIGAIVGYNIYRWKAIYEDVKHHPESPRNKQLKHDLTRLKEITKKSWSKANLNLEFDDIVKKNKLDK